MEEQKAYLSKEKFEQLKDELQELKTDRRKKVAEHLEYAKSLGDLSENAEYHEARDEQADIEDRIKVLEVMLKNAVIVEEHHSQNVEIGSTVLIKKESGEEKSYSIVGSEEADMVAGKISYQSPIGSSLLGKKKGEKVIVTTPKGDTKYTIVNIK